MSIAQYIFHLLPLETAIHRSRDNPLNFSESETAGPHIERANGLGAYSYELFHTISLRPSACVSVFVIFPTLLVNASVYQL